MQKLILTAALLSAAAIGSVATYAASTPSAQDTAKVAVQARVSDVDSTVLDQGLDIAAAKAREANGDWFQVTHQSSVTRAVTRNVNDSAESRYVQGYDDLIEVDILETDVLENSVVIEFEIGTGSMPETAHTYSATTDERPVG